VIDPNINTAAVFPGDAADGVAVVAARTDAVRHGWRVLAILSALMGFASISTDLYGLLFGIGIVGIMATNFANSRLVTRFGGDRLLLWGTSTAALGGVVLAVAAWINLGGLAGLAVPLFLFVSPTGFIVANSIAGALADFPERACAVSALVGAIQYGSGIIGSAFVGAFADGTPRPMGWVIALAAIGSLLCAWLLVSARHRVPAHASDWHGAGP
jgi:MFS transporter, DHA1 family, multidrug resistance protein